MLLLLIVPVIRGVPMVCTLLGPSCCDADLAGVVSSYVHMPVTAGAGRIAAVVALQAGGPVSQVCVCYNM
jgi:hypothetical protein